MVFERLIILNFISGYKFLKLKNKNNLIKAKLLLFVANSNIDNLSTQSSY